MCLNSAVSYKAEIALLKKKPKKKPVKEIDINS